MRGHRLLRGCHRHEHHAPPSEGQSGGPRGINLPAVAKLRNDRTAIEAILSLIGSRSTKADSTKSAERAPLGASEKQKQSVCRSLLLLARFALARTECRPTIVDPRLQTFSLVTQHYYGWINDPIWYKCGLLTQCWSPVVVTRS